MDYRKTVEHLREKAEIFKKSNFAVDGVVKCFEESADTIEQLAEELKQFKDKQEQGLLIELPCKVGDTVYQIWRNEKGLYVKPWKIHSLSWLVQAVEDGLFGKTWFLTQSEAEEALARIGE